MKNVTQSQKRNYSIENNTGKYVTGSMDTIGIWIENIRRI